MDPKDKSKKAGYIGDRSMDQDFSQPDVRPGCKDAGMDANDGVRLIPDMDGAEL